ncbi:MAG: hypothetical protein SGI71_08060 [Verrucomicrobiota bacterium]|nr:hypothetical protein [Verrucomicrobiota bacterium]
MKVVVSGAQFFSPLVAGTAQTAAKVAAEALSKAADAAQVAAVAATVATGGAAAPLAGAAAAGGGAGAAAEQVLQQKAVGEKMKEDYAKMVAANKKAGEELLNKINKKSTERKEPEFKWDEAL